jgi:hypothetical protein
LFNSFGRLVVAKQEQIPEQLMQQLLDSHVLSRKTNRAFYPFDEKAKKIYENAPINPIIR